MPNLIDAADNLRKALRPLRFPEPVSHTDNPLDYAWERHCDYLGRFGQGHKRVLLPGMNPGDYGPFLPDRVNRLHSSVIPISPIAG